MGPKTNGSQMSPNIAAYPSRIRHLPPFQHEFQPTTTNDNKRNANGDRPCAARRQRLNRLSQIVEADASATKRTRQCYLLQHKDLSTIRRLFDGCFADIVKASFGSVIYAIEVLATTTQKKAINDCDTKDMGMLKGCVRQSVDGDLWQWRMRKGDWQIGI